MLFTAVMLALASRSESDDHAPPPGGNCTPAVGAPLPLIAETKRAPPVARTLNWLLAVEGKSKALESAQTNVPVLVALARRPAATLYCPEAVLTAPPTTLAKGALATLFLPPAMVA